MANYYNEQDFETVQVRRMLTRSFANRIIGEADSNGNIFGAEVYDGTEPMALSGYTCTGFFVRPDGITLIVEGSVSENKAMVTLPAACYAVSGNFTLAIKVTSGSRTITLRIIDGTVADTTTGEIYDPGSTIPTAAEMDALAAEASAIVSSIISKITVGSEQIAGTRYKIKITKTS